MFGGVLSGEHLFPVSTDFVYFWKTGPSDDLRKGRTRRGEEYYTETWSTARRLKNINNFHVSESEYQF